MVYIDPDDVIEEYCDNKDIDLEEFKEQLKKADWDFHTLRAEVQMNCDYFSEKLTEDFVKEVKMILGRGSK